MPRCSDPTRFGGRPLQLHLRVDRASARIVVGGLIPLGIMSLRAFHDRYDHEVHYSVKYVAMYWHFLDGVWLVLFISFLVAA